MAIATPVDHDLTSLLELHRKAVMQSLNCHAVGIIQKFDSSDQTAQITIAYKRSVTQLNDPAQGLVLQDYPVLIDCPVVVLGGGAAHLEMPVAVGDECVVMFNDRDIDNWFSSGNVTEPATSRMHSFSDAIALVGLRSLQRSIEDWDMTRASLKHGSTRVGVSSSKVKIENANRTLLAVLNGLTDKIGNLQSALGTFATALGSALDPSVQAAATALSGQLTTLNTALTTYKTTVIGDLLD